MQVASLLQKLLRRHPHAVALVASKRFYFGTGGSSECFRRCCALSGLDAEVVQVLDDGRSNIREIMEVRHRPLSSGLAAASVERGGPF